MTEIINRLDSRHLNDDAHMDRKGNLILGTYVMHSMYIQGYCLNKYKHQCFYIIGIYV